MYHSSVRKSKDELRAEIAKLKEDVEGKDKAIEALRERPAASGQLRRVSGDGLDKSRQESFVGTTVHPSPGPVQPSCFEYLLSWSSCCPENRDKSLAESPKQSSSILSLPIVPLDAYISLSQVDTWTRTGWTRAHVLHLFDALLKWDFLAFCLLSKDEFLQDYRTGSGRFCSQALVHALLALATRLVNENSDDATVLPNGWFGSKMFLEETEAVIQECGKTLSLPNIQALGILALYHIRCGRESDAQVSAQDFLSKISELCRIKPIALQETPYAKVQATTYCGAVSLLRYVIRRSHMLDRNRGMVI